MKFKICKKYIYFLIILIVTIFCCNKNDFDSLVFEEALENGILASEGFRRCKEYTTAWLVYADPEIGLIPRNLGNGIHIWNGA